MLHSGFMTASEMKAQLGLTARRGDNRTLNKYVIEGKLEIKSFSRQVKLYREPLDTSQKQTEIEDWIF